jgi:hypothetical protein
MAERSEPTPVSTEPAALVGDYLDWYRETVVAKLVALSREAQRVSTLPTGWTPLELVNHLAFMEQRWFVWGFLGEQVPAPWGDREGERWRVPDGASAEDVVAFLRGVGARTREVLSTHPWDSRAATGGRFEADPPTLAWICLHVLQEYARHAGHLDVVVELAGGPTGE